MVRTCPQLAACLALPADGLAAGVVLITPLPKCLGNQALNSAPISPPDVLSGRRRCAARSRSNSCTDPLLLWRYSITVRRVRIGCCNGRRTAWPWRQTACSLERLAGRPTWCCPYRDPPDGFDLARNCATTIACRVPIS